MPGGLLNIIAWGDKNVILNGNPSKTFFKTTFSKYTNFGLQKFRIDKTNSASLKNDATSVFKFTIPRYGDLLMDSYLALYLPNIWSIIYKPSATATAGEGGGGDGEDGDGGGEVTSGETGSSNTTYYPYEFKWIEDLGTQLIKRITLKIGGHIIQELTGHYLHNLVQRDFNETKKNLYNRMTGNVAELNNPAHANGRDSRYPNAVYDVSGSEPSINGRYIYVPINTWFTLNPKMAFPLICLEYSSLDIEIEMRPIKELFVVRDVNNNNNLDIHRETNTSANVKFGNYIQPNLGDSSKFSMNRFINQPLKDNSTDYSTFTNNWNPDIHLISTFAFLTNEEARVFANQPQEYLIREVYEETFHMITDLNRVKINNNNGLVSNWMWTFQRDDVNKRNQWSNYTNWEYKNVYPLSTKLKVDNVTNYTEDTNHLNDLSNEEIYISGTHDITNYITPKNIPVKFAISFDGKYRENEMEIGIYEYLEQYIKTSGDGESGLYCYNYCLNTNPFEHQPSGAVNLSKFKNIELEFSTISPPIDPSGVDFTIKCNTDDPTRIDEIIKPIGGLYKYNYNLIVMEERYNILRFNAGNAELLYAR